ncbi:MAG: glycosyltransferase family 4 protein, partial [Steroidobacteraceae bacterium]
VLLATETFAPEIGGGERQASLLARGLLRRGHQVTLLTRRSRSDSPTEEVVDGLRILRLPPAGSGRRVRWRLQWHALPAFFRLRREYDVLLISGYRALGIPGLLAGRWLGKPVVLKADSLGEMSGEFFRAGLGELGLTPGSAMVRALLRLRARCLSKAAAQVAISAEVERELLAQGVPDERIHLIPNGVDVDQFQPAKPWQQAELRQQLGLPPGPVLVYTGRLVSYKGLPLLLDAWREICGRRPGTLVFVGEGGGDIHNCEPSLKDFAATHQMSARVRFAGAVTRVEDWLRAADLFVFPTENEAFGLSLVEAMACGLAAVTTRVGGMADYVVDGANAWVVEAGNRVAMITAIERLLDDGALAARLGQAARETVQERFGGHAIAAQYERLLTDLVVARRKAR